MELELPITIKDCHGFIKKLFIIINGQSKIAEEQSKRLLRLEQENNDLKELLGRNSKNSSKPPSSSENKNKSTRTPSGKSTGGQKGHKGSCRALLDEKYVDKIVYCNTPKKCSCGGNIYLKKDYLRHQVHELPCIKLDVTEYRLAKGKCSCCGKKHIADLPEGIGWGITGYKLTSFMSSLVSRYQLSRRDLKDFLKEHLNFNISLGTVFNKEKIVVKSLEEVTNNLLVSIKDSPFIHIDETGHKRDGKKEWMWSVSSKESVYFAILKSRGKKAMKSLVGDYEDIVISDRYSVYNHFENRQFCWAHLKRDFVKLSEKKDKPLSRIGKELLKETSLLFEKWHKFKSGSFSREILILECKSIIKKTGELLEQVSYSAPELKASRFAKNLLERFDSLWTFLYNDSIEPTNNQAERCLRKSVIWRKKYFTTRSEIGDLFVSRTASVIGTCRLQLKNSNEYLTEIVRRHFVTV